MDNQSFLKHLQSLADLAREAQEISELDDFLDAMQIFLQSRRKDLTRFSLDQKSLN
jgi:hypothetical protein